MKVKPCKICGGVRVYGKTKCFKCIIKEEREKRKLKIARIKERKRIRIEKEHNSFKYLHKIAWNLISKYVRMKGADENGFNVCYTCGERRHYKKLQAGHFYHGRLDFDLRNLKPQCPKCNKFLHGNLAVYGTKLAQELGIEGMKQLLLDANTKLYTHRELREIIEKYT